MNNLRPMPNHGKTWAGAAARGGSPAASRARADGFSKASGLVVHGSCAIRAMAKFVHIAQILNRANA